MKNKFSIVAFFCAISLLMTSCDELDIDDAWIDNTTGDNQQPNSGNLEAIDLGLSVKWGSMNLSAKTVDGEGISVYFGDGKGNDGYFDASDEEESGSISGTTYDIVHNTLGGKWRMPTKEEWEELATLHVERVYDYNYYCSKVTSSDGSYIIIPDENYWSSSHSPSSSYYEKGARYYYFQSSYSRIDVGYKTSPFDKYYIRPVCDY